MRGNSITVVGVCTGILGVVTLAFGGIVYFHSNGIQSNSVIALAVAGSLFMVFGIVCIIEGYRVTWTDH